ncbi:MAG: GMC family oxidoreductase N-terminal domain-containing protein [Thermoplasmata archaeon]
MGCTLSNPETLRTPDFSPQERATLRTACDTIVPSLPFSRDSLAFYSRKATDVGVDDRILEVVQAEFGPRQAAQIHRLLRAFESPGLNLLLDGRPARFTRLSPEGRAEYLGRWRDSRLPLKRSGFQTLKRLVCFLYYSAPGPSGPNPNWADIGYPGTLPEPPSTQPPQPQIVPIVPDSNLELTADACVIGSGAGGGVAADEIQRAGYSVVVLDVGELLGSDTVEASEFSMTGRAYDRAGTLATDDVSFQLLAGRGAGGGTFVNWMTCLRPPAAVLRDWETLFGIAGLTGPEFAQDVDHVWRTLEVNDRESQRNPNNDALWRGAMALGYREGRDYQTIFRNAVGCRQRCDFCGYGCSYACKRSSVLNYLPSAFGAGARFLFRTRAETIELTGGRVEAVRGSYVGPDGARRDVRVKCRVAVAAAGAIHTPSLLQRSGLRARPIGRGLRLHPTTAVAGEFADEVRCWAGPPQTVAVTKFLDWEGSRHGFWMEAAPAHPGLFALATPWRDGRTHKDWMLRRYRRSTATIVLLRERSRGRVAIDSHGDPRIEYALTVKDRRELQRGIQETGRVLAAAGARSLVTLHNRPVEVRAAGDRLTDTEVDQFLTEVSERSLAPNRCAMFSAHLMGSCPMGTDSRTSAVRPTGELWTAENLFVAEASVFPTAPGVNPMITVMSMARRTSRAVVERLRGPAD